MTIDEILLEAARTGEQVSLTYAGGHAPGTMRKVFVIEPVRNGHFSAVEPGSEVRKTYLSERVMRAELDGGTVAENPKAHPPYTCISELVAAHGDEIRNAGWNIEVTENALRLSFVMTLFKNGRPKKKATLQISTEYPGPRVQMYFDPDCGEVNRYLLEGGSSAMRWTVSSSKSMTYRQSIDSPKIVALFLELVRQEGPNALSHASAGDQDYPSRGD